MLLLLLLACASAARVCFNSALGMPSNDLCVTEHDPSTGIATPNCVNVGSRANPDWRCARCGGNCDCPVPTYCVKTPGPTAGTCVPYAAGGVCAEFANGRVPVYGLDEKSFCGVAIYDAVTREFLGYDWVGYCVQGTCTPCVGTALTWSVALAAQLVPGILPGTNNASANLTAYDGGSLVCDGRSCDGKGVIVPSAPWYVDIIPMGVSVAQLAFEILIFLIILIVVSVECCARCRDNRYVDKIADLLAGRAPRHLAKRGSGSGAPVKLADELPELEVADTKDK